MWPINGIWKHTTKNLRLRKERVTITKNCIVANMKRLIYLLENSPTEDFRNWHINFSYNAEINAKMKELRRDVLRLEGDL